MIFWKHRLSGTPDPRPWQPRRAGCALLLLLPVTAVRPPPGEHLVSAQEGRLAYAMLELVVGDPSFAVVANTSNVPIERPPHSRPVAKAQRRPVNAAPPAAPLATAFKTVEEAVERHVIGMPSTLGHGDWKQLASKLQADRHERAREMLHVAEGSACNQTGEAQGLGCRLGCRCGMLQRCHAKAYSGPGNRGSGPTDVGVCRLVVPAPLLVGLAIAIIAFLATHALPRLYRNCQAQDYSGDARKLGMQRAELEARISAATKLSAEQRCAILDRFCGSEAAAVAEEEVASGASPRAAES
mmetsp:Transcript_102907/g.332012  ORF Transcript_102907/g.332012 Transcript_102907/m.332012 type:complete len:298 (+) Transcript_102907:62-955(+)